jgi:hypothetical protein
MRKLTLDLESLAVQSFSTGDDDALRGTVHANNYDLTVWACTGHDPNCRSNYDATDCRVSDLGTCVTCGGTCGCTGAACPTNNQACWEDS